MHRRLSHVHDNSLNNPAITKPRAAAVGVAARHASADAASAHAQRAPTMHGVQEQALKAAELGLPLLCDEAHARTRINKQLRTPRMHSPTHLDVRNVEPRGAARSADVHGRHAGVCGCSCAQQQQVERHMLWICCDRPNAKSLPEEDDIGGACTLPALCASLGFSAPVVSFV